MYIPDIPTVIGIVTLGLTIIVLKYTKETLTLTKNEQEYKDLEDSLHKFYYPLKDSLLFYPERRNEFEKISEFGYLAEKEVFNALEEYINSEKAERVFIDLSDRPIYRFIKIPLEQRDKLLMDIEKIIVEKEKRLKDLRNTVNSKNVFKKP